MKRQTCGRASGVLIFLLFLAGLSLLLYPSVSNYWNTARQTRAILSYDDSVSRLREEEARRLLEEAEDFNRSLLNRPSSYVLTEDQAARYPSTLLTEGSDVMAYLEIPAIGATLPVYHGTENDTLQKSVGHLEWSSLPIGGESTHCVLSGHRGLPSAKLFTNLDQLAEGDLFVIRTLDEVLTYEVDRILIVLPSELQALAAEEGKDLCTLVTCTPYGVNSHRMLVRGHRVDNQSEAVRLTADAIRIDPLLVAPIAAIPLLLALLLLLAAAPKKKSRDDT